MPIRCNFLFVLGLLLTGLIGGLVAQGTENWFPFVPPWNDGSGGATNAATFQNSTLRPAGADGFVYVKDGHLATKVGRIRLLGTNLTFAAAFPSHEVADIAAARLARFGINAIRFHHLDSQVTPLGLLMKDKLTLDPQQLDKLDYFVAALKRNGIYSDLNLHVGRVYPGLPTWPEMPKYFKGIDHFDPTMRSQQEQYARDLLTHYNPYTKTKYSDEPAVVFVEINNENGFIREWMDGSFDTMPERYDSELREQWRTWLIKKYGATAALSKAWTAASVASPANGASLLKNADFTKGLANWNLQLSGGAKATTKPVQDPTNQAGINLQIGTVGAEDWHVQLFQTGLSLEKNQPYLLEFSAKASANRPLKVSIMQSAAPWSHRFDVTAQLGPNWRTYAFVVSLPSAESQLRLNLGGLGLAAGDVAIAGLSLKPGAGQGLRPGETIDQKGGLPIFAKFEVAGRTPAAQRDWFNFLIDTETAYWTGMRDFVKTTLGSKSLVIGTQNSYSPAFVQATMDVIDNHAYWHHPAFPPDRQWDPVHWKVDTSSLTSALDGGTLDQLATQRVAGKPYVITEYNHPQPQPYAAEAFPLLGAMAARQDWDGIFIYEWNSRASWEDGPYDRYFDTDRQSGKLATLPFTAALFLRGDWRADPATKTLDLSRDALVEAMRIPTWRQMIDQPFAVDDAFQNRIGLGPPGTTDTKLPAASRASSLTWQPATANAGKATIDSTNARGLIGPVGQTVSFADGLILGVDQAASGRATFLIHRRTDANQFLAPGTLVCTLVGDTRNSQMQFTDATNTSVGKQWGKAPVVAEPVSGHIDLPLAPKTLKVWSLTAKGERNQLIPIEATGSGSRINLAGTNQTLWYELEITKP